MEDADVAHDDGLKALGLALSLTEDVQRTYRLASPQERRLLNQGLFERIEIDRESVVDDQLAEPFEQLLNLGRNWNSGSAEEKTSGPFAKAGGLNIGSLVPLRGFEPRFPD
jgi:hypothetical protein